MYLCQMLSETDLQDYYTFPNPEEADLDGIVCAGGDLSPEMLISAYRQGIFPWFNEDDPTLWWSPDPRCVLIPGKAYVSKTMKRLFNQKKHTFRCDTNFYDVMANCKTIKRKSEDDTWISNDFIDAYCTLHHLGIAHSFEVYDEENILVGGLYGLSLGQIFYGESMFSHKSNMSKLAFILLSEFLKHKGFQLLDCQVVNPHLMSLGAEEMSRDTFLKINNSCIKEKTHLGNWTLEVERFCKDLFI